MRGHWVDTAKGLDLDRLGAIFAIARQASELDPRYRRRIKRALQEFKGGGTIEAVRRALGALITPYANGFELVEFPPTPIAFEIEVSSGDTWKASSLGIGSVSPEITITVQSKGAQVREPRITNKTTGQSVSYKGVLKAGQELVIDGTGRVDSADVTDQLTAKTTPPIPRSESEWQYTEFLHGKIGVFDSGAFDEVFFATPLPKVKVRFNWVTRKTSTVEVRIPRSVLEKTGIKEEEILRTLNAIKASGIDMRVKITDVEQQPRVTPTTIPAIQEEAPKIVIPPQR